MERVAVIGCSGSGKSTFATRLGDATGLPVVHLDRLFWKPGWVESPKEEFAAAQRRAFDKHRWIADGNYGATLDLRLQNADTVIVFDFPTLRCVAGALRRTLTHRGQSIQADGCPERLQAEFYRYIIRFRRRSRPLLEAALARHANHLYVHRLRSRRQADALLTALRATSSRGS